MTMLSPQPRGGFERDARHGDVAGAVERVVGAADLVVAALCQVDEAGHEVGADLLGIDEVSGGRAKA